MKQALKEHQKAERYAQVSASSAIMTPDQRKQQEFTICFNLGMVQMKSAKLGEAKSSLDKCLLILETIESETVASLKKNTHEMNCLVNLALINAKMGKQ